MLMAPNFTICRRRVTLELLTEYSQENIMRCTSNVLSLQSREQWRVQSKGRNNKQELCELIVSKWWQKFWKLQRLKMQKFLSCKGENGRLSPNWPSPAFAKAGKQNERSTEMYNNECAGWLTVKRNFISRFSKGFSAKFLEFSRKFSAKFSTKTIFTYRSSAYTHPHSILHFTWNFASVVGKRGCLPHDTR